MIDFRYHLVSIVAIFLALTVGIVMGSTVLQEPLIKSAEETTAQLRLGKEELRQENVALQKRESGYDAFVTAAIPTLVRGALAGARVVLVEAPGADAAIREPLLDVLATAGATVTGRVSLTEKFLAPDQTGFVDELAATLKPATMTFPDTATPYDKAAAVLARAIVTADSAQQAKKDPEGAGVLSAFKDAGLATFDAAPDERAELALIIAPESAYEGKDAETQTAAVVSLATALDAAGRGAVLAGAAGAVATGGVVAALRDAGDAAEKVSSVDALDMSAGRAVVVYALREQLSGRSGHYGTGAGATSFLPAGAPEPTPTANTAG